MWIAKGTLLGIWLFSFSTLGYFYFGLVRRVPGPVSIDVRSFAAISVASPTFWLWLVACLCIGLVAARMWRGPLAMWIGLAVTELFPVAVVVMYAVLAGRLHEAIKQ